MRMSEWKDACIMNWRQAKDDVEGRNWQMSEKAESVSKRYDIVMENINKQ